MGSKLIRAGGSSESEAGESGDCPIRGRGITPSTRQHRLEEVLMAGHVAVAETEVNAKPDEVWSALTDPDAIEQYMFGSRVETDWKEGSPIVWKGEYEGESYEDRGVTTTDRRTTTRSCTSSKTTGR
jgi:Activator of Hsp90 ATPase homolog 1-like protein